MKYLWRSLVKTDGWKYHLQVIILKLIFLFVNAKILVWVSKALETGGEIKYINLVILGCVINTLCDIASSSIASMGCTCQQSYLSTAYHEKVLKIDYGKFADLTPGTFLDTGTKIWSMVAIFKRGIVLATMIIQTVVTICMIGTIAMDVVLPVILGYVAISFVLFKLFRAWGECDKNISDIGRDESNMSEMAVSGFQEIRSFCTEDIHLNKCISNRKNVVKYVLKRGRISAFIALSLQGVDGAITIGVMLYLIMLINNGTLASTTALTVIMFVWRLLDPMVSIIDTVDQSSELLAALPRFTKIMDYENKIVDGPVKFGGLTDAIEFKNVSFRYSDSDSVLNNISFKISKGQKIGICGESGGGKSTLMKLIPRFYDVTDGSILIDGVDIREYNIHSLRNKIGIVSQDMYIFNGTILENVKYGSEHKTILEVIDACKKASIYDFIQTLEKGFETEVGSRGIKLSGGQKQRIALARIFLKDPQIILLDEATAALDNESENVVQEALSLLEGKTIIAVAHRLSTIKDSDVIYVIDKHRVAEFGSHKELMKKEGGIYRGLYK